MPPVKTPAKSATDPNTGLTREQALEALARLEEREPGPQFRELTDEERVIASWLRDRDHLDGCPSITDVEVAGRAVEAYNELAVAPAKALRNKGVKPGDTVIVVRCMKCGGIQHMPGDVRSKLTADLRRIVAGDAAEPVDETL